MAAGALEHLPVARVVNLNRALDSLRQEGYRVVGLDPQGTASLEEADLEGPLVVITGSEGQGLSLLTRKSCDQLVRIPLRGATPSLNASVATALVLYEVARRGWMHGLQGSAPPPRLVRPNVPTQPLERDSQPLAQPEPPQAIVHAPLEETAPDLKEPSPEGDGAAHEERHGEPQAPFQAQPEAQSQASHGLNTPDELTPIPSEEETDAPAPTTAPTPDAQAAQAFAVDIHL